jgi:hypothetical protein
MSLAMSSGACGSALLSGLWVRSAHWPRAATVALGGMLAAIIVAMLVRGHTAFVVAQGAQGFFATAIASVGITMLSDRDNSARTFGAANAMQSLYQIAAFVGGPILLRLAGLNGILLMLAVLASVAVLFVPFLPAQGRPVPVQRNPKELLRPAPLIALIGFATYFANVGAYYTYIELIGQAHGLKPQVVANCVAIGVSAGALGGGLAWIQGEQIGRLPPLAIAAALTSISALLLVRLGGVTEFAASVALYFFAWCYSFPYQLALINAVDITGRGVAVSTAFVYLGTASGAGLAALWVTGRNYHAVSWLVLVGVTFSAALFALSSALHTTLQRTVVLKTAI